MRDNGYYTLKDKTWLENQRFAGRVLVESISAAKEQIKEGITTKRLNDIIEQIIISNKSIPTFKGYNGFPEAVCISLNNQIVHGIPDGTIIKDNDVLKIDVGVTYNDAIADAAITIIVGKNPNTKIERLMEACKKSIYNVVDYLNNNLQTARVGDIGYIIKKDAISIGANVVKDLAGHAIDTEGRLHWTPFIPNFGNKGEGVHILPNMTFAIEPMYIYGDNSIRLADDKWTVLTKDIGVHFEHTLFVHNDRVEVITEGI